LVGAERLIVSASTVTPPSLLVPRTNAHSATVMADALTVTVRTTCVELDTCTEVDPFWPLSVSVDPLIAEIVPDATAKFAGRVKPPPAPTPLPPAPPPPPGSPPPAGRPDPEPHPVLTTMRVAVTPVPFWVPVATRHAPFFRLASLPVTCFVVVVFELRITFALPVGLRDVVSVKDELLIEVTGPTTEPETGDVAAVAPALATAATVTAVSNPTVLPQRPCCAISTSFSELAQSSMLVPPPGRGRSKMVRRTVRRAAALLSPVRPIAAD
jgi:hypothetical protein